jgi:hypothetical protein
MSKPIPTETQGSFRRYWEQQRRADEATTPARAYRTYRNIGYTKKGARALVEPIPDPPGEPLTAQDWRTESVEPFVPGEFLSVFDAVMTFYGRSIVMPTPRHIEDIEHWIGKPYKSELPDPLSVSTEKLCPPKTEDERVRRCSWALARDLLAAIADGTLPPAIERQGGGNPYAQVIRATDFLRWGKARGDYSETFSELLRQRDIQQPASPGRTFRDRGARRADPRKTAGGQIRRAVSQHPPGGPTRFLSTAAARPQARNHRVRGCRPRPVPGDQTIAERRRPLGDGRGSHPRQQRQGRRRWNAREPRRASRPTLRETEARVRGLKKLGTYSLHTFYKPNQTLGREVGLSSVSIVFHLVLMDMHPETADRITATIPEFRRLSGIGRSRIYELLDAGEIESIYLGTRRLILIDSYRRLIERQRTATTPQRRRPHPREATPATAG